METTCPIGRDQQLLPYVELFSNWQSLQRYHPTMSISHVQSTLGRIPDGTIHEILLYLDLHPSSSYARLIHP